MLETFADHVVLAIDDVCLSRKGTMPTRWPACVNRVTDPVTRPADQTLFPEG